MRRLLIILLLLAIVAGIGFWLLRWRNGPVATDDPWKALPASSAIIVEVPAPLSTWQRFASTGQFWGDLERIPACAALNGVMARLAEMAAKDKGVMEALDANPLLLAYAGDDNATQHLLVWPIDLEQISEELLSTALGGDRSTAAALRAGQRCTLRPDTALPAFAAVWHHALLMMSTDPAAIDEAIARLGGSHPALPDSALVQARASLGAGSDVHVLARPTGAAQLFGRWFGAKALGGLAATTGWTALDVRLRPGSILMSGLLFTTDSTLAPISNQTTGRNNSARVLPATVQHLRTINVSDPLRYATDLHGSALNDTLFQAYASWIQGALTLAEARSTMDTVAHHWAVMVAKDPTAAALSLKSRCTGGHCDTSTYRGLTVARTGDKDALPKLFGSAFTPFTQPLWTVLSDKVVFANTPADMRAAIDAWTDGTSLALDPRSGEFFRQYASDATYSWWADVANVFPLWRSQATDAAAAHLEALRPAWSGIGGCLLELSPQRPDVFEVMLCVEHAPADQPEAGALWSAAIGAPLEVPPFLLKDHLSRTLLLLAQDVQHRIHLISCTGKVLWERELDGPIIGEVQQVDRFKNGKLQMLFNTAGRIHLIDRNGKDVDGFPIVLPQPASAALSVVDYEGNKDYRIMVPTEDGHVLNLGIDGKAVKGWAPAPLQTAAIAPVMHLRIKAKDFLLAMGRDGRVTVLDRKGELRYTPKLQVHALASFLGFRPAMDIGMCQVIWSDSTGTVLSGTLDGAIDTLAAAASGEVAVFDLDSDGNDEVIRATSDLLSASGRKGEHFSTTLPSVRPSVPFPIAIGEEQAIGLVLAEREEVRMFRKDGSLWPGSPWKGAVRFRVADINLDGVLEVVTATSDGHVVAHPLAPTDAQ